MVVGNRPQQAGQGSHPISINEAPSVPAECLDSESKLKAHCPDSPISRRSAFRSVVAVQFRIFSIHAPCSIRVEFFLTALWFPSDWPER